MEISFEHFLMSILVGQDDWERFADKLGLTPAEITLFGQAHNEPSVGSFNFASQKYLLTVGDPNDVLKDCGLPVIADFL